MAKRKSHSSVAAKVASVRRDINRAVWNMAVNQLPPDVRKLLAQARGNPHIEVKTNRLIAALVSADDTLAGGSSR